MDNDNLIRMANRIGQFFAAMPERTEALEGIASHIKRFWEPRMRRQILAHLDQQGGAGLQDIVLEALRQHAPMLR
jgi:formate dehydrogenase subunit delta